MKGKGENDNTRLAVADRRGRLRCGCFNRVLFGVSIDDEVLVTSPSAPPRPTHVAIQVQPRVERTEWHGSEQRSAFRNGRLT